MVLETNVFSCSSLFSNASLCPDGILHFKVYSIITSVKFSLRKPWNQKPWNLGPRPKNHGIWGKPWYHIFFAPFGRVLSISSLFFACFATPSAAGEKKRPFASVLAFSPLDLTHLSTRESLKELKIWSQFSIREKRVQRFRDSQKQFNGLRITWSK